tara:strand:+ start:81679 stop:83223 length:1545 start_codon:yes stop_codon:yes gene_type:complete
MMRTDSMIARLTLTVIPEPELEFANSERSEYAKDGLFLFGPTEDAGKPKSLRFGVIGTSEGIRYFHDWANSIRGYIPAYDATKAHHFAFPGFEATFGTVFPEKPLATLTVKKSEIDLAVRLVHAYERVRTTVQIYANELIRHNREEDEHPDFWFVVIPEIVYKRCRKESTVPFPDRIQGQQTTSMHQAKRLLTSPDLFADVNQAAELYLFENNFHNQLKAVLLGKTVVQVVRETTLAPDMPANINDYGFRIRNVQDDATIAWNLCTTAFFKAQGKPWKIADVRPGVCYVGIVFKKVDMDAHDGNACCGAQLFLNSGDGLVFKGAVGPWYSETDREFHLKDGKARELMETVISAYTRSHGSPPIEVFIHGRARFSREEWTEFQEAIPSGTKLTGIRISNGNDLKLFRLGKHPPLRGTFYKVHERLGYLWTRGFIPRLATYPGWEVPNPVSVRVDWGEADIQHVAKDIMALTKVNFNACLFGDGLPVTLRFADAVGEILTAAPDITDAPLPFRYYI